MVSQNFDQHDLLQNVACFLKSYISWYTYLSVVRKEIWENLLISSLWAEFGLCHNPEMAANVESKRFHAPGR